MRGLTRHPLDSVAAAAVALIHSDAERPISVVAEELSNEALPAIVHFPSSANPFRPRSMHPYLGWQRPGST
jgi:hypothetical protein